MAEYTVLVTGPDLGVLGDEIRCWSTIDVTLRRNEPGSGLFTCPALPWVVEQVTVPGCRIMVVRYDNPAAGGTVLLSGPLEQGLIEQSDDGENSGVGMLSVHFADDLARVVARRVYPDPAATPEDQTVDSWTYTGGGEAALRALVDRNAGPSARPERQVPRLILGKLAGVGSPVTVTTQRMQPLGDVAREIADTSGGLGFRTRQTFDRTIVFEVYQPPDVSTKVRFGFGLGNMKYRSYEWTSPKATFAIVGGQGEGSDRRLISRINATDEALWGRSETLVSRPGNSAIQALNDDGDRALATAAATKRVTANVVDVDGMRWGTDYEIGSKVSMETVTGEAVVDVVQTVHLQAWAGAGDMVSATVGVQSAQTAPLWAQQIAEIDDRLGRVERSVVPAAV